MADAVGGIELRQIGSIQEPPPQEPPPAPSSSTRFARLRRRLHDDIRFRGQVIGVAFAVQALLATGAYLVTTWVLANAGKETNATWSAIGETLTLYRTLFGFLLVSLSAQVAHAHQQAKLAEVGKYIKLGVASALVLGVLGEALVISTGPLVLRLFEGNDTLRSDAAYIMRWAGSPFALGVLNSVLMGVLFGLTDLIYVALAFCPPLVVGILGSAAFLGSSDNLMILVWTGVLITLSTVSAFSVRIWRWRHKFSLPTVVLTTADIRGFVDEAGNVAVRTISSALIVFTSMLFGTRLNNATGSLLTVQKTLSGPLLGGGALLAAAATIFASKLLAAGNIEGFALMLRVEEALAAAAIFLAAFVFWAGESYGLVVDYSAEDKVEFAEILSPLNYWMWALGLALQAVAMVYDGFSVALQEYRFVGILYGLDFAVVYLPCLLLTQFAADLPVAPMLAPGFEFDANTGLYLDIATGNSTSDPESRFFQSVGFSKYTGILLALLLHSVVRLVAGMYWVRTTLRVLLQERRGSTEVPDRPSLTDVLGNITPKVDIVDLASGWREDDGEAHPGNGLARKDSVGEQHTASQNEV